MADQTPNPLEATHHGTQLSLLPINDMMSMAVTSLRMSRSVVLTYEPGDASRYQLTVCPLHYYRHGCDTWWVVTRGTGGYDPTGEQFGAIVVRAARGSPWVQKHEVSALANHNSHTAYVLAAAINALLDAVWHG